MNDPVKVESHPKIHISFWSNDVEGGSGADILTDLQWIVHYMDGCLAVTASHYAVSKSPFTKDEANEALRAWYHELSEQNDLKGDEVIQFSPEDWKFSRLVYHVTRKNCPPERYFDLAEADIDWDSFEEYEKARDIKVNDIYRSLDNYLLIYRVMNNPLDKE